MMNFVLFLSVIISSAEAFNILFIAPTPDVGQWYYMEEFIMELLNRGHLVTTITSFGARKMHPLLTVIFVEPMNVNEHYPSKNVYGGMYTMETQNIWMRWRLGLLNTKHVLSNSAVQNLIEDDTKKFDLVVADHSYQEAMYLFAQKFNCPLVTIAHTGQTITMDQSMGFLSPLSFVPHSSLPYADDMTFKQRIYNTFITAYDAILRRSNYIRAQNNLAKKYFGKFSKGEIPHVLEMERKVSVVLVNSHRTMEKPRPKMPGLIEIGGAHVRIPAVLTDRIVVDFMNTAESGVIYFSFGTYLKINEIPQEKLTQIIQGFGSLKQKVLIRANGEIPNLPSNCLARGWIWQNEVLAHPKMVLFVTHGGLLGVQEATGHGVPMLLIPFFNNQQRTAEQVRKNGHGKVVNFDDLTKENFVAGILEVIKNPAFKQKALQASELFKDTLVRPMQEAMYWIDYAVRHNGASHLKSSSVNFSLSKYLNYDVGIFYILLFLFSLLFWVVVIKLCSRWYQAREQKGKFKYN